MTRRRLSERLNEAGVEALRSALASGAFPRLTLQHAMEFILSDGIMPASGLPLESILRLEAWIESGSGEPPLRSE